MKENNGFVLSDIAVAIIAIFIFSGLIFSLMYSNYLENIKIKKESLSTIYLTEIMEKVAIANYEDVTTENIEKFKPTMKSGYKMNIEITQSSDLENLTAEQKNENIIKLVKATVSYKIGNKQYESSIERIKSKE